MAKLTAYSSQLTVGRTAVLLATVLTTNVSFAQDVVPGRSGLRPAEVDTVVAKRHGKVGRCYGQALKRLPTLFGTIGVGMTVAADGAVGERWITVSTAGDPELERCVLEAFAGLKFPPPGDPGAIVRYGMLLSTKSTPPEAAKAQEDAYKRSLKGT